MTCSENAAMVTSASAISRASVIICETLARTAPTVGLRLATAAFARRIHLASHVPLYFAMSWLQLEQQIEAADVSQISQIGREKGAHRGSKRPAVSGSGKPAWMRRARRRSSSLGMVIA